MALSELQKEFICSLDSKATDILKNGKQEDFFKSFIDQLPGLQDILEHATDEELGYYCGQHDGFYHYMKLLEMMSQDCADGIFDELLNKE